MWAFSLGKMPITLENYWTVGRSLLSLMAKKKVSIKKKKKNYVILQSVYKGVCVLFVHSKLQASIRDFVSLFAVIY
jgi:hypothetical protein